MPCDCNGHEQKIDPTKELEPGTPGTITLVYQGTDPDRTIEGPSGHRYLYGVTSKIVTMLEKDAIALVYKDTDLIIAQVVIE